MYILSGIVVLVAATISTKQVACFILDSSANGNNSTDCNDKSEECQLFNSTLNFCEVVDKAKLLCGKLCNMCPIDGGWSSWTDWGQCDVTCGNGTMTRYRLCDNPIPENGGETCPGNSQEVKQCIYDPCPVNGHWSPWSNWGECSVTCGTGLERRDRYCNNPYPDQGGSYCFGEGIVYNICNLPSCSGWTNWDSWSTCSNTCGIGQRQRVRACTGAADNQTNTCTGDAHDYTICQTTCQEYIHNTTSAFSTEGHADAGYNSGVRFTIILLNEGGDYNTSNGLFTCRIPGLYFFSATLTKQRDTSNPVSSVYCYLYVNSQRKMLIGVDPMSGEPDKGSASVSASLALHLKQLDKVYLGQCLPVSRFDNNWHSNSFSGFLIKPDML